MLNGRPLAQLKLRLAETLLQQELFGEAEAHYEQAKLYFEINPNAIGHIQALIGLAKVCHQQSQWENARTRWEEAERAVFYYGWGKHYTYGLIRLSLHFVLARQGHCDESSQMYGEAAKILKEEGAQYWMPGVKLWLRWLNVASNNTSQAAI
jgi:tetratricopeptide (TPR) repeat protein